MTSQSWPRVLLVSGNYPTPERPHAGTFVAALVREWCRIGVEVSVVAPQALISVSQGHVAWRRTVDEPAVGSPRVIRPRYLSFSAKQITNGVSSRRLSQWSFERAVLRCLRRERVAADIVYGHFLFAGGAAALRVARRMALPAAVAIGESATDHWTREFGPARSRQLLHGMAGILSVSNENAQACRDDFGIASERIRVIPNAVDTTLFRPHDKLLMRRELGLPADRPLIVFTGHFRERKGPLRALAALEQIPEARGIFLGSGPQRPVGEQVLFAGPVPHAEVSRWMSAADVFVFPTLAEGSPNAALEAMACGLPIVSSRIPALLETVPEEAGRLVDPMDVDAIAGALREILEDGALRSAMSDAALRKASEFTLPDRARAILDWMSELIADSTTAS